jgi:hypothetical protein
MKRFASRGKKKRCPRGMHLKKKGKGKGVKCVWSR